MNNLLKKLAFIPLILITMGFPVISFSETVGVHTIFEVKGKVSIKKKQWNKFQPASVGLTLSSDDEVEVAANAFVKVYCSNTKVWIVKSGKHDVSNGCPSGIAVIRLLNSNNDTLRADGMTEQALAKVP